MHGDSRRILKAVAKRGELSLAEAIRLASSRHNNHRDQYPLALLIEGGYVGMTLNHTPPNGAEDMREFSLATMLHMYRLPKNDQGDTHYEGIRSSGSVDPRNERVFMKAKGALYLDAESEKRRDRLYALLIGFSAGFLSAFLSSWLYGEIK